MIARSELWTCGRVGAMLSPSAAATLEAARNRPT